jgi:MFS family permease
MNDLVVNFQLEESALGHLTSAVQFGFITGTLLFALLTIADRFSPSKVFLISALSGALFNAGVIWEGNNLYSLLTLRYFTGFCLAGIYPVGMKIAADYYEKGLGKSLGFLVGALVIGTAFPHLLKGFTESLPWKFVLTSTSCLAVMGGLLMVILVPNGPYRKRSQKLDISAFFKVFNNRDFRSAAFGYFGHMWELYAFWAFVPVILTSYNEAYPESTLNVPILSFLIIGIGGIACVIGGYLSLYIGTKRTASMALFFSCLCCIVSPLIFSIGSTIIILAFLLFWGMVVIADSPLFSTLVAHNAPTESKGTALTIVNCIGFSITIISIQLLTILTEVINPMYIYLTLGLGPMFGLMGLYEMKKNKLHPTKAKTN